MFVRVVNTDGCVTIGTFDLFVNPLPLFNVPTLFELCDDAVADGFTEFDLSLKDTEITGGDPNLGVTYFSNSSRCRCWYSCTGFTLYKHE